MSDAYDHRAIEAKWTRRWAKENAYVMDLHSARRPYYNLMMFPYPSAEGLHMGNLFSYIGSDIHGRFRRAQGYDVLEPMGFDAFGIHSENYALKVGDHPARLTPRNIERFREDQLKRIGGMFDWSKEVQTSDPDYYRWTQWVFLQLFHAGLAYRRSAPVNWCPSCMTTLADEQAVDGRCERCQAEIVIRELSQWFLRITRYAERLLANLDGLDWSERTKAAQRHWIGRSEDREREAISYHLRDWCVSRQRYWGPPIPIIHCERCGAVPVPEDELPVILPLMEDIHPRGLDRGPLEKRLDFVAVSCPHCGGPARRETDVCDNFLDSSWYFLRYLSPRKSDFAFDPDLVARWLPVSMYCGGNEHATLHLMYTRFITMALHDLGHLPFEEPFQRFRANGVIVFGGAKMSKSKGNVVRPDETIEKFGADALRAYLMFLGPYLQGGDYQDRGIAGIRRFLERLWRCAVEMRFDDEPVSDPALETALQATIAKVTGDMEAFRFNTALSRSMELLNVMRRRSVHWRSAMKTLLQLLAPIAPFITQELWEGMGEKGWIMDAGWPAFAPSNVCADRVDIVVQINGKVRGTIAARPGDFVERLEAMACDDPRMARWLKGRAIERRVYVKDRLLNLVTTESDHADGGLSAGIEGGSACAEKDRELLANP